MGPYIPGYTRLQSQAYCSYQIGHIAHLPTLYPETFSVTCHLPLIKVIDVPMYCIGVVLHLYTDLIWYDSSITQCYSNTLFLERGGGRKGGREGEREGGREKER